MASRVPQLQIFPTTPKVPPAHLLPVKEHPASCDTSGQAEMTHDKAASASSTSMIKRHQTAKMRKEEGGQALYVPEASKQEKPEQRFDIPQDITGKTSNEAGMIHNKALSDSNEATSTVKRHQTAMMTRNTEEGQAGYMKQRPNIPQNITAETSNDAGMIHNKALTDSNVATSPIKRNQTAKMMRKTEEGQAQPHQTVKMTNLKTKGSAQNVPAAITKELPVQRLHVPQFTSNLCPPLPPEQWCRPLPEVL